MFLGVKILSKIKKIKSNNVEEIKSNFRQSKAAKQWLNSLGISSLKEEYPISGTPYIVDGYDPKSNTVYEYYGSFWHGSPGKRIGLNDRHPVIKTMTWKQIYERTQDRAKIIRSKGYNLVERWE